MAKEKVNYQEVHICRFFVFEKMAYTVDAFNQIHRFETAQQTIF